MKLKTRRKDLRLKNYDYSRPGNYFITICTQDFKHDFGYIENNEVILSQGGLIAKNCLMKIPEIYKNVILDCFVIMPNHIHVILSIVYEFDYDKRVETNTVGENTVGENTVGENSVGENNILPYRIYGLLSKVIKSYKREVSKSIHLNFDENFKWQKIILR